MSFCAQLHAAARFELAKKSKRPKLLDAQGNSGPFHRGAAAFRVR